MRQLSLEFSPSSRAEPTPLRRSRDSDVAFDRASQCSAHLAAHLKESVRLIITDNRSVVVSSARKRDRLEIRMHHLFLEGDTTVWNAIATFARDRNDQAKQVIDEFVRARRNELVTSALRNRQIEAQGQFHNLQEIFSELCTRYAIDSSSVEITWGRKSVEKRRRRRQRSVQLGCYVAEEKLIRVHPALDQAWVPRFYIESVVYHELLHHQLPAVVKDGRNYVHTRAFREREKQFHHHAAAREWEGENLWRILRNL